MKQASATKNSKAHPTTNKKYSVCFGSRRTLLTSLIQKGPLDGATTEIKLFFCFHKNATQYKNQPAINFKTNNIKQNCPSGIFREDFQI